MAGRIQLETRPGFTLVKDSYFPYWDTAQGKIVPTSQGFMLVYSDGANVVLNYERPLVNTAATVITLVSFTGIIAVLIIVTLRRFRRQSN
jgi:hypothetical protein